jgi:murein DD-endopeptidase MepM/ murein hydrolase activator NlpD
VRRLLQVALVGAVAAALCVPAVAFAATEAQLKSQLDALKQKSAAAGKRYSRAHWALDETDVKLARTNRKIKKTRKELAAARKRLNTYAGAVYRREDLDMLTFLVGARSFEELVTRADLIDRVGTSDARVVIEVESLNRKLLGQRAEFRTERAQRAKVSKRLRAERDRLQARLKATETQYRKVRAQLDAQRSGGRLPSGVRAAAGPNGMVFPVAGSNYYADTWGASRSGGRRRHKGTDIMARRGVPCVAVLSGRVRSSNNGLGGRTLYLYADNGWVFYYAHLDRQIVQSGRVRAGQLIGTVGSTGNAQGGSPHLHFQIHPRGGSPVNPYPYLRRME